MAVLGIGVVLREVAGQADEQVLAGRELGRDAAGGDVLVVVALAGKQVVAEAVALEAGDGGAQAGGV
ncbi:hypothetical protein LTR94_037885, partial [Friedmanniomyces endolithicus]